MPNKNTAKPTTRSCLLAIVNEYLKKHPHLTAQAFGWRSVRDSSLVKRLREGKDITTTKLDKILAFIHTNQ